jgi:hypothetical protein
MAGVSTGVSLLVTGRSKLIDFLEDFWELDSSTSYKSDSLQTSNIALNGTGVDGAANSAATNSGSGRIRFHNLPAPASPLIKSRTFVGWISTSATNASVVATGASTFLSADYFNGSIYQILGIDIANKTILSKPASGNLTTYSFPAFSYSTSGSYRFIAFSWEYTTLPNQTFKFYSSTGAVLSTLTQSLSSQFSQRLGIMGNSGAGNLSGSVSMDKICTFNRLLTAEEISFLYGSGSGVSISQIEGF